MEIRHEDGIFYAGDSRDDYLAYVSYRYEGSDLIVIEHTEVRAEYRGHALASLLLSEVLRWARAEVFQVIPECPYAARKMADDPQYSDLIYDPSASGLKDD